MKKYCFAVILAIVGMISCQGEIVETEELETEELESLVFSDSCSYTINDKTYFCNSANNFRGSTGGVDRDPETGLGKEDSLYFSSGFQFDNSPKSSSIDGRLELFFSKKYAKNELNYTFSNTWPELTKTQRYNRFVEGEYPYAVDYYRNNNQNGVSITAYAESEAGKMEYYRTYIFAPINAETSIPLDAQKESYFEIIKIHHISDGGRVVEAKFKAKVFESTTYTPYSPTYEKETTLENGYVRFKVY